MAGIRELQTECHRIAVEHGWWEDWERSIPEQLMLMVSELAEALEHIRKAPDPTKYYLTGGGVKPDGFGVELADVIIRIFDTAERYGLDMEKLVITKMRYNESRPYRHGGKSA